MARGWESKAVEDQIGSAETEKDARPKAVSSHRDRLKQAQIEALLLSKSDLLNRIKATHNERYRAQLELALAHIEGRVRELERG